MATGKFRKVVDLQTGEVNTIELPDGEVAVIAARLPETVPPLSPAQFWMQLAIDGDEAAALALIDTLPRPEQILAMKARDYRIEDPLLRQLAAALGKTEEQIDSFFRKAAKL
jgi:hypothetical protein